MFSSFRKRFVFILLTGLLVENTILTSNPPLKRTESMDPPFFPNPLWDLEIWNNSGISSFLLRIHLFLQNLNIPCRSGDI
jgi:hypothetical protein